MSEQHVKPGEFAKALRADMRALAARVRGAVAGTARAGVKICQGNVPAQFAEIRPGIKAGKEGRTVIIRSSAPHSDAVERGPDHIIESFSRVLIEGGGNVPSIPDMTAWVREHGSGRGNDAASKLVRAGLRGLVQRARRGKQAQGRASPIDAPRQIAFAIIGSLQKHRTPHRFMQASLPAIERYLDWNIQNAMEAKVSIGDALAALAASSSIGAGGRMGTGRIRLPKAARQLARSSGKKAGSIPTKRREKR